MVKISLSGVQKITEHKEEFYATETTVYEFIEVYFVCGSLVKGVRVGFGESQLQVWLWPMLKKKCFLFVPPALLSPNVHTT